MGAVCISCTGSEEPSLKGIVRAGSALVAERFVQNDLLKAGVTTLASTPFNRRNKRTFWRRTYFKVLEKCCCCNINL